MLGVPAYSYLCSVTNLELLVVADFAGKSAARIIVFPL